MAQELRPLKVKRIGAEFIPVGSEGGVDALAVGCVGAGLSTWVCCHARGVGIGTDGETP